MRVGGPTVPLLPRRRISGRSFGSLRSSRRGQGSDLAGLRPYRPGDDLHLIDHRASGRLSSALGREEFVVREHLTEQATPVVVLVDRRPAMGLFPPGFPWLSKPAAVEAAAGLIVRSAVQARCPVGEIEGAGFSAPKDCLERELDRLGSRRHAPPADSLVFLLSDFLVFPSPPVWRAALASAWDLVPVVIQDPRWEQSFPDVGGALLPLEDPAGGGLSHVRLTPSEARARRRENEARLERILARFWTSGLDSVLLGDASPGAVFDAFDGWARARRHAGRPGW